MRRSGKLAFLASLGFVLAAPSSAQQILEVYNPSLTAFLPGGSTATAVQGIRPHVQQRGVGIDGTLRAAPAFAMGLAGNPFENAWTGKESQGSLRIDLGAYSPLDVDIALPDAGIPWVIGRSYNSRQVDASGNPLVSNGYQGRNWQQTSQPELLLYDDAQDNTKDVLYLVYRADAYIEFQSTNSSGDRFKAKNGAAGVIEKSSGSPDKYLYHAQNGWQFTFLGFNTSGHTHDGLLWKVSDESATPNVAYVGDKDSASTAISNGWDISGRILYAYDGIRRYTYSYTTLDSVVRLTEVKAETKTGGTWASPTGLGEVAKVNYSYYGDESFGDKGDLKLVTITTPLSDSGVSQTKKKYYRYWEGTTDGTSSYDAGANPPRLGFVHQVCLVLGFEGARRFDWGYGNDATLDEDYALSTVPTADLKPYAEEYFEYDSSSRLVNKAFSNGSCGCGSGASGVHEYTYATLSYTNNADYDEAPASRTVVKRPDNSYLTQYFDEVGQGLGQVVTNVDPASGGTVNKWATWPERDTNTGCVTYLHLPDNLSSYTHSTGTITPAASTGVVYVLLRESSGNQKGFLSVKKVKEGNSTSNDAATYLQKLSWDATNFAVQYTDAAATLVRPLLLTVRTYPSEQTTDTGYLETNYAYAAGSYSGVLFEGLTTTLPAVSTGNNGSNSSNPTYQHIRKDLRVDYEKDEEGHVTYCQYTNGQETMRIEDAYTNSSEFSGLTIPTSPVNFDTEIAAALHRKTVTTYDAQGRLSMGTYSFGSSAAYRSIPLYYSKLGDERLVTLEYADYSSTTPTYYGPVSYSVRNQAGSGEVSGLITLSNNASTAAQTTHIVETDTDPITAVDSGSSFGSVARMHVSKMDVTGTHVEEDRTYFLIPSSGEGTEGSAGNYDSTRYGYDGLGHPWRVKEANGTIQRTVYDAIGRQSETWIGTNDHSFSGGESSGTDNMVKTEAIAYDGSGAGSRSLVESVTKFVQDSTTGQRVTSYVYDWRGRQIVTIPPTAPYTLDKYDNLGRLVARGLYSSSTGLDAGDNPTSLATARMALSETAYDEMGRVWKSTRYKITSSGASDGTLDSLNWYDPAGRVLKTDGEELQKTTYDRLGRATDVYVLAVDNDTGYGDADDVNGDIVLEQYETRYDSASPVVLMSVAIQRPHDDYGASETTGALDTNADSLPLTVTAANLKGRAQITAYWYDAFDRQTDEVAFGTYSGSTFNRLDSGFTSAPSRSDTALRTTTVYSTDGTVDTVTDPRALVTKYNHDALGRRTKEIKNYDSGVGSPGGSPYGTAQNVTVAYGYTNGLPTSMTAVMENTANNQVTTYTFGTTKGTSAGDSKIATGNLLQKETYPDSGGSSDVVTFAYNAQGQEIWKRDQAGTIIETDYDLSGRTTQKRATATGSGIDTAILRIATTYDSLGRASAVDQYDNATVDYGAVKDGVAFSYDDWGNIASYTEDADSAVTDGGTQYATSYSWEAATSGRNTLRKTGMMLPDSRSITYTYRSTGGLHDDDCSRVSTVVDGGSVTLAQYDYLGVGTVVRTKLNEISCWSRVYDNTPAYSDLDLFNRITTSRWTKDLSTDRDFYQVTLAYDRNSNVVAAIDGVHGSYNSMTAGYDVLYTMDGVNRLTEAKEGKLTASGTPPTYSFSSGADVRRDEQWTLGHTGNWDREKLDLNGDADFTDSGELDDTRTHNTVNELTARDADSNSGTSSDNYALTFDASGNLTDDGKDYKYVYDAWNRLRQVKRTASPYALVAEYRYNGLNHRIAVHEDTDVDGDVDSNDKWYYDAFDERWRQLARYRESDSIPKEDFVPHQAGADGHGGSSDIDLVICRNKDANTAWTIASDTVLEERNYYCQNWRADVSAVVSSAGVLMEWDKYSAYGTPIGLPGGDSDSDCDIDATDLSNLNTWSSGPTYDARGDINLDGVVDATDRGLLVAKTLGRDVLSTTGVANRKGYAGYERLSGLMGAKWLARNRVVSSDLGRWAQRDPLEYVDSCSLYSYVSDDPMNGLDPYGLYDDCQGKPCSEFTVKAELSTGMVQFLGYGVTNKKTGKVDNKPPSSNPTGCKTSEIATKEIANEIAKDKQAEKASELNKSKAKNCPVTATTLGCKCGSKGRRVPPPKDEPEPFEKENYQKACVDSKGTAYAYAKISGTITYKITEYVGKCETQKGQKRKGIHTSEFLVELDLQVSDGQVSTLVSVGQHLMQYHNASR